MLNCIAGIVSHNPNICKLRSVVKSIASQVSFVLLVDNGSTNVEDIRQLVCEFGDSVSLLCNLDNKGIATALNQIMQYAFNNSFEWTITLDQDSLCSPNLIASLSEYVADDVAIVAPFIEYKGNEKYYINDFQVHEVNWVITSASLTNVFVWNEIGGFDEELFIDGVDRDFCIRARKHGYKIIKNNRVSIIHELGNLECKRILGRIVHVTNHNPKRVYYMVRNEIYLDKKLGTNIASFEIFKLLFKVLVFENNKVNKVESIIIAIRDGIKLKKQISRYR